MIHKVRRPLLVLFVTGTLSLTCAIPAFAQADEGPRSLWAAFSDWLAELPQAIVTWANSGGDSGPNLDPHVFTEEQQPDPLSNGADGSPDGGGETVPYLDPDG